MKPIHALNLFRWLLLATSFLSLASCGDTPTLDPPEVRWGQDVCAECGMILSDDRYASSVVAIHDGQRQIYLYDDVGEMLAHPPKSKGTVKYWARDMQTREWIDATTAHYVRGRGLHTPMGYGVVALADLYEAQKLRDETDGRLLTYADLSASGAFDSIGTVVAPHQHDPTSGDSP